MTTTDVTTFFLIYSKMQNKSENEKNKKGKGDDALIKSFDSD